MDPYMRHMMETQTHLLANQTELLQASRGHPRGSTSFDDGGSEGAHPSALKSAREREAWIREFEDHPLEYHNQFMEALRAECGCEEGDPLSLRRYGEMQLHKDWEGHTALQRFWLILAMIHRATLHQSREHGLAAIARGAKALAKATRQKGQWAGAWVYTYLPELGEVSGGVSVDEEASAGKLLREKAQVAEAMAKATKDKG